MKQLTGALLACTMMVGCLPGLARAEENVTTWDLLSLYRDNQIQTSNGASVATVIDHSLNVERLKLTGGSAGGTVTVHLGDVEAGTYEVALNSKFYSQAPYAYGSWTCEINGIQVGEAIDFGDETKGDTYHDIVLGQVTVNEVEDDTFSFVSVDGGPVCPVSLSMKKVDVSVQDPVEVAVSQVNREGDLVTVTGTSQNLENRKVEVIVDGDLEQRYVAETLNDQGDWRCQFQIPADGTYEIEASVRDYTDFSRIIQTVPDDNYFDVEGREVWGSTVAKGPDGLYYMIFSTWYKTQGFGNDWAIYSEFGYATSTTPDGPFVYQGVALDASYSNTTNKEPVHWEGVGDLEVFHNPTMFRSEKDGKYYLYFMGTNATEGGYTYAYGRNHQRIGVAYADTPAGPWTVMEEPVIDVREGMYDSLLVSNPSVTEVKNADGSYTYYTVYKAVSNPYGTPLKGDVVVSGCGYSDSPLGPFTRSEEAIMRNPTDGWSVEDCFVWSSNGKLYALAKDFKNYFTGASGYPYSYALFESPFGEDWNEGKNWTVSDHPLAFVTEIPWASGTKKVSHLERAQLYTEDGIPFLLCSASTHNGQSPYSGNEPYNVQIPLLGVALATDQREITVTGVGQADVDTSELEQAVAQAQQASQTLFEKEDWAMLQSALEAGKRILKEDGVTAQDVTFYTQQILEKLEHEMDPSEIPFNIVLHKPVTGTNTYTHSAAGNPVSGYEPDKAVDGDGQSRWATQEAGVESVLTVDLQGTFRMDSFKITQYKGSSDPVASRIGDYRLEYFNGKEWVEFARGTGSATVISGTMEEPVTGEEIRLILEENTTIAPSILEFEVYGIPLSEHTSKHTVTHTPAKAPSCTESGNVEHWYCQQCQKYFSDAACTHEMDAEQIVVQAQGHLTQLVGEREATCTQEGYTGDLVCTVCGEMVEQGKAIAKLPHTPKETWESDANGHWHVCIHCNSMVDYAAHVGDGKETEHCTQCGYPLEEQPSQPSPAPTTQPSAQPTVTPTQEPVNPHQPDTGDSEHMVLWLIVLIGAVLGTAVIGKAYREQRKS